MKYLSVAFLLLISISGFTQQIHFVYIQTDNKQPFYVKMDKKILSSTSSGYLIIPKLQDSAYRLSIGFPKNEWQEQKVTCNINQADAGYLLKNFGEKGWGLFNLQTMGLVMADTSINNDIAVVKETKKDAFAEMLSDVVNDPGLRNAEKIAEDSIAVSKIVKKKPADKATAKKETKPVLKDKGKTREGNGRTRIVKISGRKNRDSLKMVYVDIVKGKGDTVNVVIPNDKPLAKMVPEKKITKPNADLVKTNNKKEKPLQENLTSILPERKAENHGTELVKSNKKREHPVKDTATYMRPVMKVEEPFTNLAKVNSKKEIPVTDTMVNSKPEIKKEDSVITVVNAVQKEITRVTVNSDTGSVIKPSEVVVAEKKSDTLAIVEKPVQKPVEKANTNAARVFNICKEQASGDEFLGLKKRMDKGKSDNEKLYYAHKAFIKMCYTTKQIERLSTVFDNDDGKYKFFDDVYQYVADRENFHLLVTQLKDVYFINRFNAMIR